MCKLIGTDGNIFNLVGIVSRTLRKAGIATEAKEMADKVFATTSYDQALQIIMEYVEVE